MAKQVSLFNDTAPTEIYTASSWPTIVGAQAKAAHDRNGDVPDSDVPRLTNRDAVSLVTAWRAPAATARAPFRLWYQYAAAAYGWEQAGDAMQVDDDRAAQPYPDEYTGSLWAALYQLADELEARSGESPSVSTVDVWADPDKIATLHSELAADGERAELLFKQPTPVCRDTRTGKLRFPAPRDKPGDCTPVVQDDPITAIGRKLVDVLGKPLLLVGAVYVGLTVLGRKRARRRRRNTGRKIYGQAQAVRRRGGRSGARSRAFA